MDSKREVVIDCDPGIDDALALMLALGSKDIRVVGITVVCGNVGAALGTVNVCRILELMGRTDIPVIMGRGKAFKQTAGYGAGYPWHGWAWRGGLWLYG